MSIHQSGSGRAALSGKTVAVVHPAWHSCGTHQVIASQIGAYKKLGARVLSIALMDDVTPSVGRGARWKDYRAHSQDLAADERYKSSATIPDLFKTTLLKDGWWPLTHGDQATWLVELMKRAPLPEALDTNAIDLIHANHFFVLPFAEKMRERRSIPIVLDTHDIQARQYELRNRAGFSIPPYVGYTRMLAVELDWIKRADVCIHLNSEEHAAFEQLLPLAQHELIYPSIAPAAPHDNGDRAIFVAGNNAANYISVRWFLKYIVPRVPEISISIFGDIADGVKRHDKLLYKKHRNLFRGRVAEIQSAYADAAISSPPHQRRARPFDQNRGSSLQRTAGRRDVEGFQGHGDRSITASQRFHRGRRQRIRRRHDEASWDERTKRSDDERYARIIRREILI